MPISATAAKGVINIMMEAVGGEQVLLPPTAVGATITGFVAPSGSTGMRLHVRITNWTASGTFTVTGTGIPGNTETFAVAAPTLQQTQSPQLASFDIVTLNAYSTITNITTTGLANATFTVWGIQAGKYQVPSIMKSNRKPKIYSPNEHNSFIERDVRVSQLINETTIDEVKQDIYADLSLWWAYMMLGAPSTTVSIPASPTVLLASAAVSSSMTLTTQPTAPGMKLILAITSFTVAGILTITGTVNGIVGVTETISVAANGTYYSSNVYSAVSGITNSTLAASMGITGVYGWKLKFLSSANKYSAAIEWYDGAGSWIHPYSFATEGDFDVKVMTEATISIKGKAQDKLPIGDRTTTPLSGTNRVSAIGASLSDLPIVGWQSLVYLDSITGTPATTSFGDLQELKVSLKTPDEDHYTFTNSQNFNRVYAGKRECAVEAVMFFIDFLQWEQFRQNLKQYLSFQFLGRYIGTDSSVNYYKSWTWTLPIKSDGEFDVTSEPSKAPVTAKIKARTEYDSGIGGSYQLQIITTMPPTYTA